MCTILQRKSVLMQTNFNAKMNKGEKTKSFVLSDESINTYGFRCLTEGGDLKQFKRNPVMYYNHDEWGTPIGRWENIRVENGQVLADPVFDLEDERAAEIAGKVERGFLRMASIGFRIVAKSDDPKAMLAGQKLPTVTRWQLREASIVGIGSNHNAIRLYDDKNNLISENEIMKLFDNSNLINKRKMKKETFTLLDIQENSTDELLHETIEKLVDGKKTAEAENKTLKEAAATRELADNELRKAESVRLVDEAIKDGRLNADAKAQFLSLFDNDFESAKKVLTSIPKRLSVQKEIEANANKDNSELADMVKLSWDELDKGGKLATLKDKYPDVYKEKYEGKFGAPK